MSILAKKKIRCGCGTELEEVRITVTWQDSNGIMYTILDVPSLQCNRSGCEEVYYAGDVQFSLSVLADEMEQGFLPMMINYQDRI